MRPERFISCYVAAQLCEEVLAFHNCHEDSYSSVSAAPLDTTYPVLEIPIDSSLVRLHQMQCCRVCFDLDVSLLCSGPSFMGYTHALLL